MNLRKAVFFMTDKKHAVKNSLDRLSHMENASEAELEEYVQARINMLLESANKNVPFYKELGAHTLEECPVVSKQELGRYEQHISTVSSKRVFTVRTSGSTGTPFVSYMNAEKKACVNAELIFHDRKMGSDIGMPCVFLRSLTRQNAASRLKQFMQNARRICVSGLSERDIEQMLCEISAVSARKPVLLSSYASTLDAFAAYEKKHGSSAFAQCNLRGIVSGSELLYETTRAAMERIFGTRCVSRYANQENGVIAQEEDKNGLFRINRAHYHVEILRLDSDLPQEPGKVGRIVVTDLFNTHMPYIRYDTCDIGAMCEQNGRKYLTGISGRRLDMVYNDRGECVSPHRLSVAFWEYPEIAQYKLIQNAERSYCIRLFAPDFSKASELKEQMKGILGENASIELIIESEPFALSASGKCRYIENTWKREKENRE